MSMVLLINRSTEKNSDKSEADIPEQALLGHILCALLLF